MRLGMRAVRGFYSTRSMVVLAGEGTSEKLCYSESCGWEQGRSILSKPCSAVVAFPPWALCRENLEL